MKKDGQNVSQTIYSILFKKENLKKRIQKTLVVLTLFNFELS